MNFEDQRTSVLLEVWDNVPSVLRCVVEVVVLLFLNNEVSELIFAVHVLLKLENILAVKFPLFVRHLLMPEKTKLLY